MDSEASTAKTLWQTSHKPDGTDHHGGASNRRTTKKGQAMMEKLEYTSWDGTWWIVHDPYNGNDDYELIHLPTREDGSDGSQGSWPTLAEAMGQAEAIQQGTQCLT